MKIMLLRPRPDPETIGLQHVMVVEPLELEVLGGLVSPPDHVVIVDLILEKQDLGFFLRQHEPDVLGVTGYITNVPAMIDACKQAKAHRADLVTMVGGVHVEVCPEDLDDPSVDYRVVRNGPSVFPLLLTHIREHTPIPAGVLVPGETCDPAALPEFDWSAPRADRSLVERYRARYFYIFQDRVALIKTAFGCPYACSFCFCREITGHQYHERDLSDVLDELASLPQEEIYIVDDDFLVSVERVRGFMQGLKERKLQKRFLVYGRADFISRNEPLLAEFKALGLRTVIVGFESFSDRELQTWKKGTSVAQNEQAMVVLNRLGIDCFATIILPPHWDLSDFQTCGEKIRELGIRYVNLQPLTPLPGTGQRVSPQDLLIPRQDYARWDLAHLMLRPTKLSEKGYYRELMRLYQASLYRPMELLDHARRYTPRMLWKMLLGTIRVRRQYQEKMKQASDQV